VANTATNPQSQRIKKRQQVVAVADARTSSVVVTATKDLIDQIGDMIQELDHHSPKESSVQVFHLNNADPQQVLPVLQDMFQSSTATRNNRSTSSQNSLLMNRVQQYQNSNTGTTSSFGSPGRSGGSAPQF
jgi:type II secretory pathway component GspD/PulD (secretin)